MKRLQRKQLKEDELVTGLNKFIRFLKNWTKEIIILAALVLASLAVFSGYKVLKAQSLRKESQVAGQILALRAELNKNPGNVLKLEQMAGKGKFSRMAYILLATYWIEQGELDKARLALEKVKSVPKDLFFYQAQDLLAQIHTLRLNYDKALDIFKRIEEDKQADYALDVIIYHHAEALERKGARKESLALYKRLQEEFPQTYYGYDASLRAKKLESGQ